MKKVPFQGNASYSEGCMDSKDNVQEKHASFIATDGDVQDSLNALRQLHKEV